MANGAWRVTAQQQPYIAAKSMLDVFNNKTPRVYRVYRIWALNNQYVTATGAIGFLNLYRTLGASGGWPISPIPCDTSNFPLNPDFSAGLNRTISLTALLRRVTYSPDEIASYVMDWDALLTYVDFAQIWDSGYGSSSVEPLTMRASQTEGYSVYNPTFASGGGLVDLELEFTDKAV